MPGDPSEFDEKEAGRRGLPDFIIHDGASWCLFFESKVQAALTQDQLARHERTLRRRGFVDVRRAVLTKANVNAEGAIGLTWSGLYEWLGKNGTRSEWAERLRSYLRAAEVRLARENYLTEGTLTMFDGFRFSAALLHGSEQIADLPVPVAESPGAVRIGHPERGHLVEYLAPNSVFNSLPRQRSSPHLRPDDRLVTIDRVFHHASLGAA